MAAKTEGAPAARGGGRRRGTPLLLAALLAAPPAAARAELFRYRFRPGQKIEHRISIAGASMMGPNGTDQMFRSRFRMVLRQTQRVRSVRDGIVTLELTETLLSGAMQFGEQSEAMPKRTERSLLRMTERGRFLSTQPLSGAERGGGSPLDSMDVFYGLNFPARDVKPGDSWYDTLKVGRPGQQRAVRVTWKYIGRERFRGRDCARILASFTVPLAEAGAAGEGGTSPGQVSGTATIYFDPQAGQEVYSTGSLQFVARAAGSPAADTPELVSVMKINIVQSLLAGAGGAGAARPPAPAGGR